MNAYKFLIPFCLFSFCIACGDDEGETPEPKVVTIETIDLKASIIENPEQGTVLGSVSATASDGSDISFELTSQNIEGAMALNASTGEVTVADASAFDFETNPTLTGSFSAMSGEVAASGSITITVDLRVEIVATNFEATMDENSPLGTVIGSVEATVNDNSSLTYSLRSENMAAALAMDANTGELTIADSAAFDFETNEQIVAAYTATNGETEASANILITLNDRDIPVTADFEASATSIELGNSFTLTSTDNENVVAWLWELFDEDGNIVSSSDAQNTNVGFRITGIFDVRLTVTSREGNQDVLTKEDYIEVYDPTSTYAIEFSTNKNFIEFNNMPSEVGQTDLSISLWFKTSYTRAMVLAEKNNADYGLYTTASGAIQFAYRLDLGNGNSGFGSVVSSDANYGDGEWHHVVITKGNDGINIYLDGNVAKTSTNGASVNLAGSGSKLYLGVESNRLYKSFYGSMAEVQIWRKSLSNAYVSDLYNCGEVESEEGLIGYWDFNTSTSTIEDKTENGNNGDYYLNTGRGFELTTPVVSDSEIPANCQ